MATTIKFMTKLNFLKVFGKASFFYLKNLILIVALNLFYLKFLFPYCKRLAAYYLSSYISNETDLFWASWGVSIAILYTLKILIYTIMADGMYKKIGNTFSSAAEQVFMRFFPVMATSLFVLVSSGFLTVLAGIGVLVFIFSIFAPFLAAVRVKRTGSIHGDRVMMGAAAIIRSAGLIKECFFRVIFYNVFVFALLFLITEIPYLSSYSDKNDIHFVKYVIFDFAVMFNATLMMFAETVAQNKDDVASNRYDKKFHFKRFD